MMGMAVELWLLKGGDVFAYLDQDPALIEGVFDLVGKHLKARAAEAKLA